MPLLFTIQVAPNFAKTNNITSHDFMNFSFTLDDISWRYISRILFTESKCLTFLQLSNLGPLYFCLPDSPSILLSFLRPGWSWAGWSGARAQVWARTRDSCTVGRDAPLDTWPSRASLEKWDEHWARQGGIQPQEVTRFKTTVVTEQNMGPLLSPITTLPVRITLDAQVFSSQLSPTLTSRYPPL